MELLRQLGICQYGIGLWPALRAYRTFIRPVLEYGLAIIALSAKQKEKLHSAQKSCIKMTLNRNRSTHFPTIVPMVLADLPSMNTRTRILQLKFVTRIQHLPVTTMARSIELTFLWDKNRNKQWKHLTSNNSFYQLYNKLKNSASPPKKIVSTVIKQKRDDEFTYRSNNKKTVRCLRPTRIIDPILYLPASRRDRHRLVKWRMHWLPSYPLKDCRCGNVAATREHYQTCPLLLPPVIRLTELFGSIPSSLHHEIRPIDYILNSLPRNEIRLALGKWQKTWPALLRVLREIDRLSHPEDNYEEDEPDPEDALINISPLTHPAATST